MSGQNFVKNDVTDTGAGLLNQYLVDTTSYIYDMFRNAYPKAPKLIGMVPFARSSEEGYSANALAGSFNTLYGELHMSVETGEYIQVGVINDKGEVVVLIYEGLAGRRDFYYKGIISFITVDPAASFAAWSFWGWLLTQGTQPIPIITGGLFMLLIRVQGLDNPALDATLTEDPGHPVYSIGAPDPDNAVRGFYADDVIWCLFQLPIRGLGTLAADYDLTTYTGPAWALVSALQSASMYSVRANFSGLSVADQIIDFAFDITTSKEIELLIDGATPAVDPQWTDQVANDSIESTAGVVNQVVNVYDNFSQCLATVRVPKTGALFTDDYSAVNYSGPAQTAPTAEADGAEWVVSLGLTIPDPGDSFTVDFVTVV